MAVVSEKRAADGRPDRSPDGKQPRYQHEKLHQSEAEAESGAMTFQEIRNQANRRRGIPLEQILLLTGAKRDRYDRAKWHTGKGPISCTATKFMNWNQGIGGGGAINLALHPNDVWFRAGVAWLCDHCSRACTHK